MGLLEAGIPLVALSGLILLLQRTSFGFASIRKSSMYRTIFVNGYIISWIAEFFMAPGKREVTRELEASPQAAPNRLTTVEPPSPIGRNVVILQLESFGWEILGHCINGKQVTPFLNELTSSSRVFKIQVYHDNGSAQIWITRCCPADCQVSA